MIVIWRDKNGIVHRDRAQDWVRNIKHGQIARISLGVCRQRILARRDHAAQSTTWPKAGDFICVSNFPSAMLDLPIESSQANEQLLFQALPSACRRSAPASGWC